MILGIFHAIGKFFERAVWKLGILDGIPGMIIAMNSVLEDFRKTRKEMGEIDKKIDMNQLR